MESTIAEKLVLTTIASNTSSTTQDMITQKVNSDDDVLDPNILLSDKFDNTAVINEFIEDRGQLKNIDFNITNSSLSFKFEIVIKTPAEEGLYILSFFNCFQPSEKDLIDKIKTKKKELVSDNFFFEYSRSPEIKFGVNMKVSI